MADQKPKPLLDADARAALGKRVEELWRDDNADRAAWLKDRPKWLNAYQGRPIDKTLPWPGAANLHVPLTRWHTDAIHARLMSALVQPTPLATFAPQEPSDAARATKTETFLDYAAREEVGMFPVLDRCVLGTCIHGIQFTKQTWELKTAHRRVVHEFPADLLPQDVIQAVMQGELQFREALERVESEAVQAAKQLLEDREIAVEVTQLVDGRIRVVTEREDILRDAPRMTLIEPEDIAVNADAPHDLQDADHVLHRYWLTVDEIRRMRARGTFDLTDDELEELERLATTDVTAEDGTQQAKETRDGITGVAATTKSGEPARLAFLDAYLGEDVNDDDLEEQIIATVCLAKSSIVPRVKRLESVFRHGMRPFVAWHLYPLATTFWSIGIPQVLDGLQVELNTIHNQRVDSGTISNTPFGWYVPAAGFNPEKIPIEPGYLQPIDQIDHVKMHTPANYTAWGFQEEANLLALAERLTKVNDLTMGRIGETQGAARTAAGVQALDAKQATGFDVLIRRMQESMKLCLQQILALYAQYMPPGKETRILGKYPEDSETVVAREDLQGRYDLRFTGNSLSTDRELERQVLTFMANGPMNPSALQFYLQLGVTTPQGIAQFLRGFLEAFDRPDVSRIITMPKGPVLRSPEEIVNRTLNGERLDANPGEQHQAVVQALTAILNGPDAIGLAPEIIAVAQDQIQRRTQQAQTDMLAQQMQAMTAMMAGPGLGAPAGPGAPPGSPAPPAAPPGLPMGPPGMVFAR